MTGNNGFMPSILSDSLPVMLLECVSGNGPEISGAEANRG